MCVCVCVRLFHLSLVWPPAQFDTCVFSCVYVSHVSLSVCVCVCVFVCPGDGRLDGYWDELQHAAGGVLDSDLCEQLVKDIDQPVSDVCVCVCRRVCVYVCLCVSQSICLLAHIAAHKHGAQMSGVYIRMHREPQEGPTRR